MCLAFLVGIAPLVVGAQEAPDQPREERRPAASLRSWMFPGNNSDQAALTVKTATEDSPRVLAQTQKGTSVSSEDYGALPPGNYTFEIKVGDQVVANETVILRDKRFYTALAWKEEGGKWALKFFADGPALPNSQDRPVRVLNFAKGRETLVSINGGPEAKVATDSVQEIKLAPKVSMITVKVMAPEGGPPAQSSLEMDLTSTPSAYVVIAPDYRGRMRPGILTGGEGTPVAAEPAPGGA